MTQHMRDTNSKTSGNALEGLPTWDLTALYPGRTSKELKSAISDAERSATQFREKYATAVADLTGDELSNAIRTYEAIDETLSRILSFAYLEYAGDISDPETGKFFQAQQEQANEISAHLIFFTLELCRIDESDFARMLKQSEKLSEYEPWLRDVRALRNHQLSDEMERLLHEKQVAGRAAWNRLFDETIASLRFTIDDTELTEAETLSRLSDPDRQKRAEAGHELAKVLGNNIRLFTHVTNTLAKDKEIDDKWRNFARPVSSRNLSNHVEDEVVDALVSAVKASYPQLSHRYYAKKAQWLGLERLEHWDRNAPLPDSSEDEVSWDDAQNHVLSAYEKFSPTMASIGQRFFDENWIDAQTRPGKASGAFSHPTVPSAHPYILMNYQGKSRDVMTLAHELGHGVHQVFAADQGHLMSNTPLTLAETASVFGEMLTFRGMLAAQSDPVTKRIMLAGKVEDMLNTVVRQVAFFEFERIVHDERREGELLPERLGEIWLQVQKESLGPIFDFDPGYRHFWAYIPHFIHSPFYVYAYAFGDCLVNSLYAVYQDAPDGFENKYLEMLRAGGTLRHKELLAPFGLDATDASFWQRGLNIVSGLIDQLEEAS